MLLHINLNSFLLSCFLCVFLNKVLADDSFTTLLNNIETWNYDIRMPNITPSQDNLYLCVGDKIDTTDYYYITRFAPLDETHNAHHILLYGCEEPGKDFETEIAAQDSFANAQSNIWSCGEMASKLSNKYPSHPTCRSKPVIIYAWAHMAPQLTLPPKTGFKIGLGTSIKYLVMQIHYLHKSDKIDNSGIQITLTNENLAKRAGVLLMMTGGSIPPKSIESMEVACKIEENIVIHPFAFRVHTHKYGYQVSGYVVRNGQWILIGQMSPQKEQMFYPIEKDITIRKGDIIAARCLMNNTSLDRIYIGPTDADEMCNFYIMYNYDVKGGMHSKSRMVGIDNAEALISEKQCFSPGPPYWYWESTDGFPGSLKAPATNLDEGDDFNPPNYTFQNDPDQEDKYQENEANVQWII